ncbi:MAG TPA: uridine diphosphate-N-acetylglucosamine-binding protein YvcK [Nocardioides sp.]
MPLPGVSVAALGGGHGLHASLAALRRVVGDLTAVVTVADNGGSSGRLRGEFGVLPPGDLRMALAALCGDDDWGRTWAEVLQHRFAGEGDMRGHVVGNMLIVGLWELLGDHVPALDWVGRLLGAQGRVLPMAVTPMDITADVRLDAGDTEPGELVHVRGQVEVASTAGRIVNIQLDPSHPEACPEALETVQAADWVVLGPGSWYTSVIPHLMVPDLRRAIVTSSARVVVVLNLADQPGETSGYGPEDHLDALLEHAPDLRIDTVVADAAAVEDAVGVQAWADAHGARVVLADVALGDGTPRHDPARLARVFEHLMA